MANGAFIAYHRVSTREQGASGLGIEAQRAAVAAYLNGGDWSLLGEFTEIESGKDNARPQLAAALRQCRLTGAKLVIAKLDRLSRNVAFLTALMDGDVEFVACDNPHATRFTLHILAAVAEHEAAMISTRTKAALAAAKVRGVALGGVRSARCQDQAAMAAMAARSAAATARATAERTALLAPTLAELQGAGLSLHQMAAELAKRGIVTPRGGAWTATGVRRILGRAS